MKLLDVEVVLNRDKGIQVAEQKPEVMKEFDDTTTNYAILSHRWGAEVNYEEMIGLMKMDEEEREELRQRHGYQKIIKSCEQAAKDGYQWLWIDTCCIDKRSSAELSEAINSMYRWYQNAQVCYAYLNDVDGSVFPTEWDGTKFAESNGWPEWFVRGWTLQELIAPKEVRFFNKDWVHMGSKRRLADKLVGITGIPHEVLTGGLAGKSLCVAQIMSWAVQRKTTRVEDQAYSLMGLFGVNMPMLYGEGKKAFQRLQLEIIRRSSDQSIFAWNPRMPRTGSVLADDPSDFRDCGFIKKVDPNEFVDRLIKEYIELNGLSDSSRNGIDRRAQHQRKLAALCGAVNSPQFHTLIVTNAGIQVLLPVVPSRDSPSHCRAILACSDLSWSLLTIDLVSSGHSFVRTSIDTLLPETYPEFKTLYLFHHQDTNETCRQFSLDDKYASYHGFTRRGAYPREFTGNTVTLSSLADDLIVIVYANNEAQSYFAIGLGYLGQEWVHVDYDGHSPTERGNWMNFGKRAYDRMWRARAIHARDVAQHGQESHGNYYMKHAHLPRSIWAARIVWGRWEADAFKVMVDVVECPGCCDGPYRIATTSHNGLAIPDLMKTVSHTYLLWLDEQRAWADECSGQRIVLGDYGDYSDGNLVCSGNIFEDMRAAGINLDDSYCPVVSHVSSTSAGRRTGWMKNQDDLVVEGGVRDGHLVLHKPKAMSLPTNECFVKLLKSLSTRLAGKHLVTAVIQCSDFYMVDKNGNRKGSSGGSTPDSGSHSTEAEILTPLCTIASPQVWRRERLCMQRMQRFRSIRERFCALVDMHQLTKTESSHKSVSRQKTDMATKFFSDLFGLEYLENYIGKITFFTRFPSVLSGGRQFAAAEPDLRLETVLPLLHRRCQILCKQFDAPRQYADERQRLKGEIKPVSQTLGAELLENIMIAFRHAYDVHALSLMVTGQANFMKYDRQLDLPSVLRDIQVLQKKLDETKDEDEQRALEEDIAGKILWLFLCGICAEVDELLPKVVKSIQREESMKGLREICRVELPTDPSDDQAHLWRIMFDAGANTSKYQLWLDAKAREQAGWSGTNRGTPIIREVPSVVTTLLGTAQATMKWTASRL